MHRRHRIARIVAALATSATLSSCVPEDAPTTTDPRPIYEGTPRFDVIPAELGLESLFSGAPAATYSSAEGENRLLAENSRRVTTHREQTDYIASLGSLASTLTRYTFPRSERAVTEYEIRASDLLDVVRLSIMRPAPGTDDRDVRTKDIVTSLSDVRGQLFPLKVGNELSFRAVRMRQAISGAPSALPQESTFQYAYVVLGVEDGFAETTPPVIGNVFHIECVESGPGGGENRSQLYYSETLGRCVRRIRAGNGTTEEYRLSSWR